MSNNSITDEDIEYLLNRIKPLGKEIGDKARAGDHLCQEIINVYTMFYVRQEHVAYTILNALLDEYEKR